MSRTPFDFSLVGCPLMAPPAAKRTSGSMRPSDIYAAAVAEMNNEDSCLVKVSTNSHHPFCRSACLA
ncbi:hypothetical protein HaLaN_00064 [Haematococcus lacustris]|uniref:Uncharacterized protein n=1 Tax=Haematococcus lacustris TaxID=44745 RepID=A0A699Y5S8_HAELA|nr:hypothetical protein HaLaN_00064 [Haematococcus lacustris]